MRAAHSNSVAADPVGVFIRQQGGGRLVSDSRAVKPGDIFLAYPGERQDGRRFIPDAIAAGAAAVLWEPRGYGWHPEWRVAQLPVARLRQRAGVIASRALGRPSHKLRIVGVTGTNGKTSCSHWIAQSLSLMEHKAAVIGTLGHGAPGRLTADVNTTPDPVALQYRLAEYLAQGSAWVAMEVSSHGLEQGRVNGVCFDIALFTNLSRDHLDYHRSMEDYGAAKARLFRWPGLRHAVINLDDRFGAELVGRIDHRKVKVWGYGMGKGEIAGHGLRLGLAGLRLRVATPLGEATVESPLLGAFNAMNLLGVLGVLLAAGMPLAPAVEALHWLTPVPGRMETLGGGDQPLVVVDYAHTPDALEKVLETLRDVTASGSGFRATGSVPGSKNPQLICVFGCGGERDRGKCPLMGEVATRLADRVILTSDNPRGEDPRRIIADIEAGAHPDFRIVEDRALAIAQAIHGAEAGDVVLIAGKGHENFQEIAGVQLPFSDVEVARLALERWRMNDA